LTIREYAEIMGVSPRTVTNWVREDKVKSYKKDGKRLIVVDDKDLPKPVTVEMRLLDLEKEIKRIKRRLSDLEEQNKHFLETIKKQGAELGRIKEIFRKICKEGDW